MKNIQVGTRAPDFGLPCTNLANSGQGRVSLADYEDRWLVLIFYPRDFSMI
jgi:peroxiredoxin